MRQRRAGRSCEPWGNHVGADAERAPVPDVDGRLRAVLRKQAQDASFVGVELGEDVRKAGWPSTSSTSTSSESSSRSSSGCARPGRRSSRNPAEPRRRPGPPHGCQGARATSPPSPAVHPPPARRQTPAMSRPSRAAWRPCTTPRRSTRQSATTRPWQGAPARKRCRGRSGPSATVTGIRLTGFALPLGCLF